jgi:hypothetical protein
LYSNRKLGFFAWFSSLLFCGCAAEAKTATLLWRARDLVPALVSLKNGSWYDTGNQYDNGLNIG